MVATVPALMNAMVVVVVMDNVVASLLLSLKKQMVVPVPAAMNAMVVVVVEVNVVALLLLSLKKQMVVPVPALLSVIAGFARREFASG